jgi:hypothetical protein
MAGDALLAVHQHDADLIGREGPTGGRRETGEARSRSGTVKRRTVIGEIDPPVEGR